MIIPVLRTSIIYSRNPDLTVGAITFRPFGPVANAINQEMQGIFHCISGYHFFMAQLRVDAQKRSRAG